MVRKKAVLSPPGFVARTKPTGSEVAHRFANGSDGLGTGGVDWYKFPSQANGEVFSVEIRILPAWTKGTGDPYWVDVCEHFGEVQGDDGFKRRRGWVCRESIGEKCPGEGHKIQHYITSRKLSEDKTSGDARYYKLARELVASRRTLVQVLIKEDLHRHGLGEDMKPTIMRLPTSVWKKIQSIETHKGNVSCWEWGMPLRIIRTKTGEQQWNIEYDVVDMDRETLEQEFWPILGNLYDLSTLLDVPEHEEENRMLRDAFPASFQSDQTQPQPQLQPQPQPQRQAGPRKIDAMDAMGSAPPGFGLTPSPTPQGSLDDDIPF